MRLSRQSRIVAALIMLVSMLAMQGAVAACRCFARTDIVMPASEALHGDAHTASANNEGHLAHSHQDRDGSCDAYPQHSQLTKNISDGGASPQVAPFVPSAVILVLRPATNFISDPAPPYTVLHSQATAPPICIRYCTFQI